MFEHPATFNYNVDRLMLAKDMRSKSEIENIMGELTYRSCIFFGFRAALFLLLMSFTTIDFEVVPERYMPSTLLSIILGLMAANNAAIGFTGWMVFSPGFYQAEKPFLSASLDRYIRALVGRAFYGRSIREICQPPLKSEQEIKDKIALCHPDSLARSYYKELISKRGFIIVKDMCELESRMLDEKL